MSNCLIVPLTACDLYIGEFDPPDCQGLFIKNIYSKGDDFMWYSISDTFIFVRSLIHYRGSYKRFEAVVFVQFVNKTRGYK